jgi:hypothetical protein
MWCVPAHPAQVILSWETTDSWKTAVAKGLTVGDYSLRLRDQRWLNIQSSLEVKMVMVP